MTNPVFTMPRTILGILHDPSPPIVKAQQNVISEFVDAGARSIGLELSPRVLQYSAYLRTSFTVFARYASSLGLDVVPLVSDEVADARIPYAMLTHYITPDSRLDVEKLEHELAELENDLEYEKKSRNNPYAAPEQVVSEESLEALQLLIERQQTAKKYAEEIDGNLDLFAQCWAEWNIKRVDADIASTIQEKQPDLVVIGAGHAESLPELEGYTVALRKDLGTIDTLPEVTDASRLRYSMQLFYEKKSAGSARAVYEYLNKLALKQSIRSDEVRATLDQALHLEPDLFNLGFRVIAHQDASCRGVFAPHEDIAYFKLTAQEAERRILAALNVLP